MGTPPVGAGRSRAHPAYEWDRPTRTPTARIVLNDPVPRRRQRRPEHPVGGLHVQERGRGVEVVNCCFAPVEALFCGVGGPYQLSCSGWSATSENTPTRGGIPFQPLMIWRPISRSSLA